MVTVPGATAVTKPVVDMVAIAVLLLLHTPPAVASLNKVVLPTPHIEVTPVITEGVVTVTNIVA